MKTKPNVSTLKSMAREFILGLAAAVCWFVFSGCEYDVPITSKPTGKVDERLLGDWTSKDGKDRMKVRKYDDFFFIVSFNGDLFRACHSDVAKTAFVSVQEIDSGERKYAYFTWKLSEDGKLLGLRAVRDEVVPKETKDSAAIQKLIEKNLQNPKLFEDEGQFTREK